MLTEHRALARRCAPDMRTGSEIRAVQPDTNEGVRAKRTLGPSTPLHWVCGRQAPVLSGVEEVGQCGGLERRVVLGPIHGI